MIQPTRDRILVQPSELDPGEQERPSGLIVPTEHHELIKRGIVVAVGGSVEEIETGMSVIYAEGHKAGDGLELIEERHVFGWETDE